MAPMHRRAVLASLGTVAIAGCVGSDDPDEVDRRGEIGILIDGEPMNLSADRFQAEYAENSSLAFHLHADSDRWYNEGEHTVTVADGLALLPEFSLVLHDDGYVLTVEGETYDTRSGNATIEATVNGEDVTMHEYVLQDGDEVVVEIETGA